jgi:uncharacterized Fe-S cluster protein YjdI
MARKTYSGPIVDVSFDGALCQHAAECIRGLPSVFDTSARPWIDPRNATTAQAADVLREVVGRCPSGALEIVEKADAAPDIS